METSQNKFLSVSYQLYTVDGDKKSLVEQTQPGKPFQFISGFGVSLDAFEQHIAGLQPGAEFDFTLAPAEAFGDYDDDGVRKLNREMFCINDHFDHENIYPGAVITLLDSDEKRFMARVVEVEEDGVTIDTNHPLAGKALNFKGKVIENREATEEEIQKLIKMLTGGCQGCGHHGDNCGEGCGEGCGHCH